MAKLPGKAYIGWI